MRLLAIIGALLLAAPASALSPTPTATPLAVPTPTPIAVPTDTPTAIPTATPSATPTAKAVQEISVAVFLVNSSDLNNNAGTSVENAEEIEDTLWTEPHGDPCPNGRQCSVVSARTRWLDASYGIYDFVSDANDDQVIDIFGPYESDCPTRDPNRTPRQHGSHTDPHCCYVEWRDDSYGVEVLENAYLADYDHIVIVVPWEDENTIPEFGELGEQGFNDCSWGGLGQIGGRITWYNWRDNGAILGHEMGHNLWMNHSADKADIMGSGYVFSLSGAHMVQQEWLPRSSIVEISSNDTAVLLPLYVDPYDFPGLRVAKILAPRGDPYYVSFRDDSNSDVYLLAEDQLVGHVHRWDGISAGGSWPERIQTIGDGETFIPTNGSFSVEVTDISEGAEHLEMSITVTFLYTGTLGYNWRPTK
jgi:hypothetical protein